MNERLKSAGLVVIGLGLMVLMPILFFKGAVWASEHLLPFLISVGWLAFFIDVLILLPLSLVRRLRPHTGGLIYLSSYLFGLLTWLFGFLVTYSLWGGFAVVGGLMFFGVGVVFMAALATMFKAMWGMLAFVVGLVVVTYASRLVGLLIGNSTSEVDEVVTV
jgi:hypothetical protein